MEDSNTNIIKCPSAEYKLTSTIYDRILETWKKSEIETFLVKLFFQDSNW